MIRKLLPNTPWMAALLMTFSSVILRVTFLPSTSVVSWRFSVYTTAMCLPRLARVMVSIRSPARESSLMLTIGPSWSVPAVALVI